MKLNKSVNFDYNLAEAVSSGGVQFALLDDKGNIRHKPIRCKDYVQDVYWSELLGKGKIKQYGFEWDGSNKSPISKQKKVQVAIMSDGSPSLQPDILNILRLVNTFEKAMGIPLSIAEKVEDNTMDIIVTYDNGWSKLPCFVSLLFLLLRIGRFYDGKADIESVVKWFDGGCKGTTYSDQSMIMSITKSGKVKRILEGYVPTQKWSDYSTVSSAHNSSGIVNYSFDAKKGAVLC